MALGISSTMNGQSALYLSPARTKNYRISNEKLSESTHLLPQTRGWEGEGGGGDGGSGGWGINAKVSLSVCFSVGVGCWVPSFPRLRMLV